MNRYHYRALLLLILVGTSLLMLISYQVWAAPSPKSSSPVQDAQTIATPTPVYVVGILTYQGTLTDSKDNPITDTIDMVFRFYDVPTGGTPLWVEEHTGSNAVPVQNGLFRVNLGSLTPFPQTLWQNERLYLGIQVGQDPEMSPREVIGSVAWAAKASVASQAQKAVFAEQAQSAQDVPERITHQFRAPILAADGATNGSPSGHIYIAGDSSRDQYNASGELTFGDRAFSSVHFYQFTFVKGTQLKLAYYNGNSWWWNAVFDGPSGDLRVHGSISQGAIVERNLQTPEEQMADSIPRFEQGDVLCWSPEERHLEKCNTQASPLIVAVANEKGKPIVLGVEPVKVLGPVKAGDLLVSSNEPGYAVAWSQVGTGTPPMGKVIAKALENCGEGKGLILAMILTR